MIGISLQDRASSLKLAIGSLAVTFGLWLWIDSLRADVGAYFTVRIFLSLFLYQDHTAALLMAGVVLVALWPPLQRYALVVTRIAGRHPAGVALSASIAFAAGAIFAYHCHPLSMDEYAAVFQSRIFAEGRVFGELPVGQIDFLVVRGFQGYFLAVSHQSGQVASMYWPGFALLLTPFTKAGVPWLANPLLGGLAIYLMHRLMLEFTGNRDAAGMAALLTLASPAVSINAISYYSMTGHLVCNLGFALLLLRPSVRGAFAAGLVGSLALVMHNPVPHILFAIPWLAWLSARADRWQTLPAIALGYLPLTFLLGLGWPHVLAQLPTSAPGVVRGVIDSADASIWWRRLQAIVTVPALNVLEDRAMATAKLWLWAVPGLLILSVGGLARARSDVRVRLLAWSGFLTFFGYLFVPVDQGHGWGFRYFHSAWFVLPALSVLSIWPLATGTDGPATSRLRAASQTFRADLAGYVAACALLSLTVMTGLRLVQVEHFMARHLAQVPLVAAGTAQVVLIDPDNGYYVRDLVQNDPFLRNRPIYAVATGTRLDSDLLARLCPGCTLLARNDTAAVWGRDRPAEHAVQ